MSVEVASDGSCEYIRAFTDGVEQEDMMRRLAMVVLVAGFALGCGSSSGGGGGATGSAGTDSTDSTDNTGGTDNTDDTGGTDNTGSTDNTDSTGSTDNTDNTDCEPFCLGKECGDDGCGAHHTTGVVSRPRSAAGSRETTGRLFRQNY